MLHREFGCAAVAPATTRMPPVLHFIWWQGWDKLPKERHVYFRSWREAHPHYQVVLWDRLKIEQLVASCGAFADTLDIQALYRNYRFDIQRIDLARLLILHCYGGVYSDLDILCLRPIDTLLDVHAFYVCREQERHLSYCNAFMAAAPGHPIIAKLLVTMQRLAPLQARYKNSAAAVLRTTGPRALTAGLVAYRGSEDVFCDPNPQHFFAKAYSAEPALQDAPNAARLRLRYPEAYGVHHWAGGWRSQSWNNEGGCAGPLT